MVCRVLDIAEVSQEIKFAIAVIEELEDDRNTIS